ncbi:WhiB family transcriptional regulator [Kitasatospora sp. A2-31]|uniref:WhiB family transcriptional regulator n=1 Tax=Kitasatospora sp. A2-31 TaxID=2916414 RepID=UPI001EEDF0E4|nr:WhiB family transcriptional regulator [Kitasatospora sp. A2-31]MCG6499430.1 WhiB family transcriptional regulator [Kitasatospora sp. A2-31]
MIPRLDVDGRLPCQDSPDLFGGREGERPGSDAYKRRVRAAQLICGHCPIRLACRDLGRGLQERDVWGGEDDKRRAAAGTPPRRRSPSNAQLRGRRPAA